MGRAQVRVEARARAAAQGRPRRAAPPIRQRLAAGHGAGANGSGQTNAGANQANGAGAGTSAGSSGNFIGHLITVSVGDSRYFVPGLLLFALLCLAVGPLLYMYPSLRKSGWRGTRGVSEDEGGEPSPIDTG